MSADGTLGLGFLGGTVGRLDPLANQASLASLDDLETPPGSPQIQSPRPAGTLIQYTKERVFQIMLATDQVDWALVAETLPVFLKQLSDTGDDEDIAELLLYPTRAQFFFDGAEAGFNLAGMNRNYTADMRRQLRELLVGRVKRLVAQKNERLLRLVVQFIQSMSPFLISSLESLLEVGDAALAKLFVEQCSGLTVPACKAAVLKALLHSPSNQLAVFLFPLLDWVNRFKFINVLLVWVSELSVSSDAADKDFLRACVRQEMENQAVSLVGAVKLKRLRIYARITKLLKDYPYIKPTKKTIALLLMAKDSDVLTYMSHHLPSWLQSRKPVIDPDTLLFRDLNGDAIYPVNFLLNPCVCNWLFDRPKIRLGAAVNTYYTPAMGVDLRKRLVAYFIDPVLSDPQRLLMVVLKIISSRSFLLVKTLELFLVTRVKLAFYAILQGADKQQYPTIVRCLLMRTGFVAGFIAKHFMRKELSQFSNQLKEWLLQSKSLMPAEEYVKLNTALENVNRYVALLRSAPVVSSLSVATGKEKIEIQAKAVHQAHPFDRQSRCELVMQSLQAYPGVQLQSQTIATLLLVSDPDMLICLARHLQDWLLGLEQPTPHNTPDTGVDPAHLLLSPVYSHWLFSQLRVNSGLGAGASRCYSQPDSVRLATGLVHYFVRPVLYTRATLLSVIRKFLASGDHLLLEALSRYLGKEKGRMIAQRILHEAQAELDVQRKKPKPVVSRKKREVAPVGSSTRASGGGVFDPKRGRPDGGGGAWAGAHRR